MNTPTIRIDRHESTGVPEPPCMIHLPRGMTLEMLVDSLARDCWEEVRTCRTFQDGAHGWPLIIRSAIKAYLGAAVTDVHAGSDGGLVYELDEAGQGAHQVGARIAHHVVRVVMTTDGWVVQNSRVASELPWVLATVVARYLPENGDARV